MESHLEDLFKKIQKEGIAVAEAQAKEIESGALSKAKKILEESQARIQSAEKEMAERLALREKRFHEEMEMAKRDLLAQIQQEIQNLFQHLLQKEVDKNYEENLDKILCSMIENWSKEKTNPLLEILLSKKDLTKIRQKIFSHLSEELKEGITLKAHPEISSGFRIRQKGESFYFDLEGKSLAQSLYSYFSEELRQLLKTSGEEESRP